MLIPAMPKSVRIFLHKELIWDIPNKENNIYLSFDDGPNAEVSPKVLDLLDKFNAKATFFMIGKNAEKYPDIHSRIIESGHAIGNHTYNHLRGWNTDNQTYIDDVKKANEILNTNLFRPPYGRIRNKQVKLLSADYKVIMWSVLSGDFNQKISKEVCYQNVAKNIKSGSIIVFHDSLKAKENMLFALPKILEEFTEKEFNFKPIIF